MKLTKGLYAYCIIDRESSTDNSSVLPDQTFLIQYHEIAALLSSVSESSWQPTKKNIMRHQKVIARMQAPR